MKRTKRILSVVLCLVMILVAVPLNVETYAAGVDNITARADYLYNIKWTARETVKGWREQYTFYKGETHRIPYGQPVSAGKYVYWDISIDSFLSAANTAGSIFYTKRSDNKYNKTPGATAPYYAMDCSALASFCWGLSRRTTTSVWKDLSVTDYGECTNSNVGKIQQGDALNLAGEHIVIVSRVTNGTYEITEQTPPEVKRSTYSASQLVNKYSSYKIYRYNKRDSVPAAPAAPTGSSTVDIPNGFYTIQSVKDPDKVLDIQGNENRDGANIQLYDNVGTTVQKFWIEKTSDYYTIKNVYTKRWLDISSPYDTDGCNIQLWNSNTRTEQKWRFEDAGNGNVYIHSLYGMYVDTDGGNTYNGVNVETYHFDGTPSQQWKLIRTSGSDKENITEGVYLIRNVRNTSKVLDIYENSTENGANIQLYDDVNSTVQYFRVVKNEDYYSIQSVYSNDWLDIALPCDKDGCNIQLWFKDTVKEQNWTFEDAGNGNYYIRSLYGMYIDTEGGATSNNTNVETYHYDGSTSQQWKLERVYTVTYDANNGTGAPAQQYKRANNQVTLSSTKPTRTGYTFKHWSTTKNDVNGSTRYNPGAAYSGNADLTLYAIWQPATYQINYNYNGGTAGPTSQTKVHGQDLVLSTVIPSRVGYAFQNWNTKLNGTGTVYMPGDTYKANEAVTLYAAWKTCTHTWNSGTVANAATCTATGTKNVTCTICGATGTETIPVDASNHVNTTNVAATASTCTVKGYSAGVYCNDCKKYISGHQEQPLAAHQTETRNARAATCTAEGYTGDQYCTVCKQTISTGTTIGKKAHSLTTINQKDANCTEKGYTGDQYCTVCKQTISTGSTINALGHTAPDGNGNCTRCGTHIKDVTPSQPQTNPNACKWCGGTHNGFIGAIVGFFHRILAAIFGAKY